jgi:tetratricopeptide (TPR) repeat protein
MDVTQVGTDIFSYTTPDLTQLDQLANGALSSGIDRYSKKDYKGAIKEFKRAIGLSPSSSYSTDAANYMAQAYLRLNDTKGAISAYKTSLKLDPSRDDTHALLGNIYMAQKDYQDAQQQYGQAVKWNPSAGNIFSLGQAYMYNGRYNDAEAQFNKVRHLDPNSPNGYYGLGQTYNKEGRYNDAVNAFQKAVDVQPDFYDAYLGMGYAYADSGQMDQANKALDVLKTNSPDLAATLSSYIYQVEKPKITYGYAYSSFFYSLPAGTKVSALSSYLANANASKTFTMTFQFDKEMDRTSVENTANWSISRATGSGPGGMYNYGMAIPSTEVRLPPCPTSVYYDSTALTATLTFSIQQNSTADGTIDPSHVEFTFNGKDAYGVKIDPKANQFNGFSGIA